VGGQSRQQSGQSNQPGKKEQKKMEATLSTVQLSLTDAAATEVRKFMEAEGLTTENGGLRLFVDMFSAQYLSGVTIDYVTSVMGSGFTFTNPNASGGCGCGSSFSA